MDLRAETCQVSLWGSWVRSGITGLGCGLLKLWWSAESCSLPEECEKVQNVSSDEYHCNLLFEQIKDRIIKYQ